MWKESNTWIYLRVPRKHALSSLGHMQARQYWVHSLSICHLGSKYPAPTRFFYCRIAGPPLLYQTHPMASLHHTHLFLHAQGNTKCVHSVFIVWGQNTHPPHNFFILALQDLLCHIKITPWPLCITPTFSLHAQGNTKCVCSVSIVWGQNTETPPNFLIVASLDLLCCIRLTPCPLCMTHAFNLHAWGNTECIHSVSVIWGQNIQPLPDFFIVTSLDLLCHIKLTPWILSITPAFCLHAQGNTECIRSVSILWDQNAKTPPEFFIQAPWYR